MAPGMAAVIQRKWNRTDCRSSRISHSSHSGTMECPSAMNCRRGASSFWIAGSCCLTKDGSRSRSIVAILAAAAMSAQERRFITPSDQVIAIRAGRLFDSKAGTLLNNQVVLIRGDRITDVGAGLQIPRDAKVIDLSSATVLPGMIDA